VKNSADITEQLSLSEIESELLDEEEEEEDEDELDFLSELSEISSKGSQFPFNQILTASLFLSFAIGKLSGHLGSNKSIGFNFMLPNISPKLPSFIVMSLLQSFTYTFSIHSSQTGFKPSTASVTCASGSVPSAFSYSSTITADTVSKAIS